MRAGLQARILYCMSDTTVTYLELRESDERGEAAAGLSHSAKGLVLLHVLEVAAAGEPKGVVTIVHDAGEHGGRYLALARQLAAAGYAVALPDLRGHGKSEGPRGHTNGLREVLRDLSDVQDHLAYRLPEAPKVLVGFGLGANWCAAFGMEKGGDLAALALVAPLLEPRFEEPKKPAGLGGLFKKVGPTSAGRVSWSAEHLSSDPAQQAAWRGDEACHGIVTLRAAGEARTAAEALRGVVAGGPPLLCVAGADDPVAPMAGLEACFGSIAVVAGRHAPAHDAGAARLAQVLVEFLGQRCGV